MATKTGQAILNGCGMTQIGDWITNGAKNLSGFGDLSTFQRSVTCPDVGKFWYALEFPDSVGSREVAQLLQTYPVLKADVSLANDNFTATGRGGVSTAMQQRIKGFKGTQGEWFPDDIYEGGVMYITTWWGIPEWNPAFDRDFDFDNPNFRLKSPIKLVWLKSTTQ